ncbi:MAG TPA: hypothetical protein VFI73_13175 [Candidatus Nitrosopolaris sp.]|nr:hypothetical protein [Candidatus Nitrosopolaris sp.]
MQNTDTVISTRIAETNRTMGAKINIGNSMGSGKNPLTCNYYWLFILKDGLRKKHVDANNRNKETIIFIIND